MIRRLTAPQIPPGLHEAGWRLWHGPYGWQCGHLSGNTTHCHAAPGVAIAEAWDAAEPDHERLQKINRQFYRIIMRLEL
jgi:hypothetical protein